MQFACNAIAPGRCVVRGMSRFGCTAAKGYKTHPRHDRILKAGGAVFGFLPQR
jgi:hypothetical protein